MPTTFDLITGDKTPDYPVTTPLLMIERNMLATLMSNEKAWDCVGDILICAHFSYSNQPVFNAIGTLVMSARPSDVNSVALFLKRQSTTRELGLVLPELMRDAVPATDNGLALARMLLEEYTLSQIHAVGATLMNISCPGSDAAQVLAQAAESIQFLQDALSCHTQMKPLNQLIVDLLDSVVNAADIDPLRVESAQDEFLFEAHLVPGHLVGLCGEPSAGKTSLASQLFASFSIQEYPAAFFTMEMAGQKITQKLMASTSGVRIDGLVSGQLNDDEWPALTNAVEMLRLSNSFVDDSPTQTLADVMAKCGRLKRQYGVLSLVVIDHLRCITLVGNETFESVAIALKVMARQLNCCVVLVSHGDAPLQMSADLILKLAPPTQYQKQFIISIIKNRNEEKENVQVTFKPEMGAFKLCPKGT